MASTKTKKNLIYLSPSFARDRKKKAILQEYVMFPVSEVTGKMIYLCLGAPKKEDTVEPHFIEKGACPGKQCALFFRYDKNDYYPIGFCQKCIVRLRTNFNEKNPDDWQDPAMNRFLSNLCESMLKLMGFRRLKT